MFSCPHCGKKYKSKAGHDYHVRSEHTASVSPPEAPAARGAGPSPPGGDCRAAEPVGRTEPGRAGPGKAGAAVGPVLFSPSNRHARVLYHAVLGGTGCTLLNPSKNAVLWEWSAAFPFPSAHRALLQPTLHLCCAEKKTRPQATPSQVPTACQCWGGRIYPWGASLSVLLIPTDSASDTNHSLNLITGDV